MGSIVKISYQPLVLKVSGQLPTVPIDPNAIPSDSGWRDTDILLGQHAYNAIDNIFYIRKLDGIDELIHATGFKETDPIFTVSPASTITTDNIINWEWTYESRSKVFDGSPIISDIRKNVLDNGGDVSTIGLYEDLYVDKSKFGLSTFNNNYFDVVEGIVSLKDFIIDTNYTVNTLMYYGNIGVTNQLISNVITGTAPFIVQSKTKVENLNSDLLDGYEAEDLLNSNIYPIPTDEVEAVDPIIVNVDVGGYKAGDTLLADTTVKEFMEKILRLYSLPTIKEYESIHTVFSGITTINEVASTVSGSVVPTIKDGLIANADHSADTVLKGGHDTLTFSGTGINTTTGAINTPAILGNNTYTTSIHFLQGTVPYYDSNGVAVNNLDSERNEETKTYSISFKGIYPKMYGMSATDFSADTTDLYATLTHDLSYVSTTEYYNINGTDSYIYFVLPANHEITRVVDGNGFDVTGNFSGGIHSVTTPNYTTNFYILKSIALTSVSPAQTYKIITKTV